jgi:hypothetical protein
MFFEKTEYLFTYFGIIYVSDTFVLFTLELQRRKNVPLNLEQALLLFTLKLLLVTEHNRAISLWMTSHSEIASRLPIVVKRQLIRKSDDCSICPNSNEFNGDFIDFFSKSLNSVSIESYLIADKENLANSFHNYLTEKTESNK